MLIKTLNQKQIEKLSDIASDLGLVSVASVVLPAALEKFNVGAIMVGIVLAVFFWLTSVWFRR